LRKSSQDLSKCLKLWRREYQIKEEVDLIGIRKIFKMKKSNFMSCLNTEEARIKLIEKQC